MGLVWQQRRQLLLAGACLLVCTASNLAAPVLTGMLMETLVKQKPVEEYVKVGGWALRAWVEEYIKVTGVKHELCMHDVRCMHGVCCTSYAWGVHFMHWCRFSQVWAAQTQPDEW